MRLYVQWTLAAPGDWVAIDMTRDPHWRTLPKKPEPVGGEVIDQSPGWVMALNIQGVIFGGYDHYSVRYSDVDGALIATGWNDDPVDWPPGTREAYEWTFLPPAPDARLAGRFNTVQTCRVFTEQFPHAWEGSNSSGGPNLVLPWSSFTPPQANMTRHGIWVSDTLLMEHFAARTPHGWREWLP